MLFQKEQLQQYNKDLFLKEQLTNQTVKTLFWKEQLKHSRRLLAPKTLSKRRGLRREKKICGAELGKNGVYIDLPH